jgi:hypothetical protein
VSGRTSYFLPTNELLVAEEKGKVSCVVLMNLAMLAIYLLGKEYMHKRRKKRHNRNVSLILCVDSIKAVINREYGYG